MSDESKNGTESLPDSTREKARQQFYRIGAWQMANTIRQNLGLSRASTESHYGDKVKNYSFLDELPLGSTSNVTINEASGTTQSQSPLKNAALVAALVAASGGAGFIAADYFRKPAEPIPVDAVFEVEVPIVRDSGGRPVSGDSE